MDESNLYLNQENMLYVPSPAGFPRQLSLNPKGFISPSEPEYNMKFEVIISYIYL